MKKPIATQNIKRWGKKTLALGIAMLMIMSLVPVVALGADGDPIDEDAVVIVKLVQDNGDAVPASIIVPTTKVSLVAYYTAAGARVLLTAPVDLNFDVSKNEFTTRAVAAGTAPWGTAQSKIDLSDDTGLVEGTTYEIVVSGIPNYRTTVQKNGITIRSANQGDPDTDPLISEARATVTVKNERSLNLGLINISGDNAIEKIYDENIKTVVASEIGERIGAAFLNEYFPLWDLAESGTVGSAETTAYGAKLTAPAAIAARIAEYQTYFVTTYLTTPAIHFDEVPGNVAQREMGSYKLCFTVGDAVGRWVGHAPAIIADGFKIVPAPELVKADFDFDKPIERAYTGGAVTLAGVLDDIVKKYIASIEENNPKYPGIKTKEDLADLIEDIKIGDSTYQFAEGYYKLSFKIKGVASSHADTVLTWNEGFRIIEKNPVSSTAIIYGARINDVDGARDADIDQTAGTITFYVPAGEKAKLTSATIDFFDVIGDVSPSGAFDLTSDKTVRVLSADDSYYRQYTLTVKELTADSKWELSGKVLGYDRLETTDMPLQGAKVTLFDDVNNVLYTETTVAGGSFTFKSLPNGEYELQASTTVVSGFLPTTSEKITIADKNYDGDPVVIVLDRVWTVNGIVRNEAGEGVQGATVRLVSLRGESSDAMTNSSGEFAVTGLVREGEYAMTVSASGYGSVSREINVSGWPTHVLADAIVLSGGGSVEPPPVDPIDPPKPPSPSRPKPAPAAPAVVKNPTTFVESLYKSILGRDALPGEVDMHMPGLEALGATAVIRSFVFGIEAERYMAMTDTQFVIALYEVFLGRTPAAEEITPWVINVGSFGKEAVFGWFAAAPEFLGVCASYGVNP